MTIEEKQHLILYYCKDTKCSKCLLRDGNWKSNLGTGCISVLNSNEEDLDTAIALINGVDPVNRPSHYTDGNIEVIEFIEDKGLGFCLGNAIKYISRAGKKDPTKEVEDLNKAKWYIERRIKELIDND